MQQVLCVLCNACILGYVHEELCLVRASLNKVFAKMLARATGIVEILRLARIHAQDAHMVDWDPRDMGAMCYWRRGILCRIT